MQPWGISRDYSWRITYAAQYTDLERPQASITAGTGVKSL